MKNKDIKGITVAQKEIKVSAFADDTTLYIGDNRSFPHLKYQLRKSELFAGVKYNRDKCFGLWLGNNRHNIEQPLNFNWSSYEVKILGYTYGYSQENWLKVKTKIQQSIKKWSNLKPSLIGRKTIINQVLRSKIWYLAYVEISPKAIIQKIERDIYNFLRNHKKIRINRVTTQMQIKEGGLEITDIETQCKTIKCAILAKFIKGSNKNKPWRKIMLWHLGQFRNAKQGVYIFKTYIPKTNRGNKQERFYRNLLTVWTDVTNNEKVEPITLIITNLSIC